MKHRFVSIKRLGKFNFSNSSFLNIPNRILCCNSNKEYITKFGRFIFSSNIFSNFFVLIILFFSVLPRLYFETSRRLDILKQFLIFTFIFSFHSWMPALNQTEIGAIKQFYKRRRKEHFIILFTHFSKKNSYTFLYKPAKF